ncbi:MAG: 3-deoxy-D-manno-octulosonic acid transferase [Gammaproteobacteria bacterium]
MSAQSPGSGYRLLSLLLLPLWLIHALRQARAQNLGCYFPLRFLGTRSQSKESSIWVHAASVGEVEAISPLVKALRDQGESVLFTAFTASGYKTIRRNFADSIETGIVPVDFIWFCRRFFRQHRIKLCLLMETELWPELLFQATRNGLPIIRVNARLSRKSIEAPIFIRYLIRRTLDTISLHLIRNESDREALIQFGVSPKDIKIAGNLKSRIGEPAGTPRLIEPEYLLLASSREGEESTMLSQRPAGSEKLLIVIAPRHPARSDSVQQDLRELGVNYAVRSRSQAVSAQTEVYLADTLGELKALMAHARIVVMGGSFDQSGGHNIIEPATLACPIITGPSDSNIREDIALLGDGSGIFQVRDMAECWEKITQLLENPEQAKALGEHARQVVSNQPDVLDRYLAEIKPFY